MAAYQNPPHPLLLHIFEGAPLPWNVPRHAVYLTYPLGFISKLDNLGFNNLLNPRIPGASGPDDSTLGGRSVPA